MSSLTRTVASGTPEPVTLDELKLHCKIDNDSEDVQLNAYLMAARQALEEEYATALIPTTCVLKLDNFPFDCSYGEIELRIAHVSSVISIGYVDANGNSQTLSGSNYELDAFGTPARIRPAFGLSWPSTRVKMNAVTVTFMAGYATPDVVPANVKVMILLLAAEMFDKREPTVTGASVAKVPSFASLMITENWGGMCKGYQ